MSLINDHQLRLVLFFDWQCNISSGGLHWNDSNQRFYPFDFSLFAPQVTGFYLFLKPDGRLFRCWRFSRSYGSHHHDLQFLSTLPPFGEGLTLKTIGNRKGDCAWSCSRWQTQPEKICKSQRTNQCHSLRTLNWFVLCNLLIFSGCVCHLEQLHAQSPFLFPIVFSINLIPFFDICSVDYLLFFHPSCSGICAALLGPLRGRNSCCLWFWQLVFGVLLRAATSNLPSYPSQTAVCSTMGESIRPSSFHNPTLSANMHVVQTYRSSLSAAVQTVQVSVEPRLSTALQDRSVVP